MKRLFACLLFCSLASAADISGSWLTGTGATFTFRMAGDRFSGTIEGRPGERSYRIVDGTMHGDHVSFFVLHDDPDDPEVMANGGKAFHNTADGTIEGDVITVSGAREGTGQRPYKLVLKRVK